MGKKRIQRGIGHRTLRNRTEQGDRNSCRGPKRTYDEALIDRCELAKMDIFRKSQAELARQLSSLRPYSVSQQTISRDLKLIKAEMLYNKNLHLTDPELFKKLFFKDIDFTNVWCSLNRHADPYGVFQKSSPRVL
jgi:hypothetical protein